MSEAQDMLTHAELEARVQSYIDTQANLDLLRFITCGSVDDGKSTLIGRMLYEAQLIFEDQVTSLQQELGRPVTLDEASDAVLHAFENVFERHIVVV